MGMTEYGVDAARQVFFQLLESDEAVVITRDAEGMRQRAVLSPLSALTRDQREAAADWPAQGLTQARPTLGTLVAQAAAGRPQRLQKRRRDVAVLLPEGASGPAAAVSSERTARALTAPAAALDSLAGRAPLSYGLPALDDATGGLLPGRFALVAAPPGVGGSLLVAGAAGETAVTASRPVLYAASGPSAADVTARIAAAHAGANYQRLRAGTLDAPPHILARLEEARNAPLLVDDGDDLDTDAIAATVPDIAGLALVVVDRLQAAGAPDVPLSGDALPTATRALTRLARDHGLPVMAAVDSTDPALLSTLHADVLLRLERDGEDARLTVTDADFAAAPPEAITLRPDFLRARFLDTPLSQTPAAPAPPTQPVVEAAAQQRRAPSKAKAAPAPITTSTDHGAFLEHPAVKRRITRAGQREAVLERLALLDDPDIAEEDSLGRLRLWDAVEGGADMDEAGVFGPLKHGTKPPFWQPKHPAAVEAFRSRDGLAWSRPYEGDVVCMDRNASWPAAVASVKVVHGGFEHTGELEDLAGQKTLKPGYYLTRVYPWTEAAALPAPIEGEVGTDQWVTAPRMQLLAELAAQGRWPDAVALDSHTGDPHHLREFGDLVNILRRYALTAYGRDSAAYEAVKRGFGMCLGLLTGSLEGEGAVRRRRWQCKARRVDWVHTIKDQATITMWRTADKIVRHVPEGPVALKNTDELWLPAASLEQVTSGEKPLVRVDETGTEYGTYGIEKKNGEAQ